MDEIALLDINTDKNEDNQDDYEDDDGDENLYKSGYSLEELMQMVNIAEHLETEVLNRIGSDVVARFDADKATGAHREERIRAATEMAMQITQPKNTPWPSASNVIYPIITSSAMQFNARLMSAVMSGYEVCKGKVIGNDEAVPIINPNTGRQEVGIDAEGNQVPAFSEPKKKQKKADRTAEFVNWQLMQQEEEWKTDTDTMFLCLPIVGMIVRKRYYDPLLGRNASKIIFPSNFVVQYTAATIKSAPVVSEVFSLCGVEIKERVRAKLYLKKDYNQGSSVQISDEYTEAGIFPAQASDNSGVYDQEIDQQHTFIEQHCRIDLDNDGYPEPYTVIVHKDSECVARIVADFEEDEIVRDKDGMILKIAPMQHYTRYAFLPSLDGGIYATGIGELLLPINATINTLINQLIDAGTKANGSGGFIGRGIRIATGTINVPLNAYIKVDSSGEDLQRQIYDIPRNMPSPVLFEMLGVMIEAAKEIANMKDVLSGDQAGNVAPFTSMAMIEQGLTTFKSIYQRIYWSVADELKIQYSLNKKYISNELYTKVLDDPEANIDKDFDMSGIDLVPVNSNADITDMQKITRANLLFSLKDDPLMDGIKIREEILNLSNISNAEDYVVEPQPAPEDPMLQLAKAQVENDRLRVENEGNKNEIAAYKTKAEIGKMEASAQESLIKAETSRMQAEANIMKVQAELIEAEAKRSLSQQKEAINHYTFLKDEYRSRCDEVDHLQSKYRDEMIRMAAPDARDGIADAIAQVVQPITQALLELKDKEEESNMQRNKPKEAVITKSKDGKTVVRLSVVGED